MLQSAKEAGLDNDIRQAALRLTFTLKDPQPATAIPGVLVLDDENGRGTAAPHYFHKQCFVSEYHGPSAAGSRVFRVTDANVAIFQPEHSPQVPTDYFAVDVRLQLKPEDGPAMPVVCRFPSAVIEETLLDSAKQILSQVFSIGPSSR